MKVCFLHVAPIADEPRVRRQGDALHAAGYDVVGVGSVGGRSPAPEWRVVELEMPRISGPRRIVAMARQASSVLGRRMAFSAYWSDQRRRALLDAALAEKADVYVAREWRTLPIGVDLRSRTGAGLALDSPELSAEEREDSRIWRWFFRPQVVAIEERDIPSVQLVTAVSEGIGQRLRERYQLRELPTTLRNFPAYQRCELREPGETVEVLFHGAIAPSRGIEAVVGSVTRWPANYRLTLRGPGDDRYVDKLRALAASVSDRITFAPPVPLTRMVTEASTSDIGILAQPDFGTQTAHALPNKMFEYLMAGLAVCISDLPAMGAIVDEWECGVKIALPFGADQVAEAIQRMATSDLVGMKRAALRAAEQLNWEREAEGYVAAFAKAFGPPR